MSEFKNQYKNKKPATDPNIWAGRLPPQSIEAERYVLGAILQDPKALNDCLSILKEDDTFYQQAHSDIFKAISELSLENAPIDLRTVEYRLEKWGKLESIGGREFLFALVGDVASSANVEYHAKIVQEKSVLRKMVHSCSEIIGQAMDPSAELKGLLDEAGRQIFSLAENRTADTMRHVGLVLQDTLALIDKYAKGLSGVRTGFRDLDLLTSGLQSTDFIVLAGRPGMGKTAFALSLMANAAIQYNHKVAFFSLEMGGEQLIQRVLCSKAGVSMELLRQGKLPREDHSKIVVACGPISKAPIYIDDRAGLTILELKSKCRLLKQKHGLDMIIVDYLQLMEGPKGSDNRQHEVSVISRGMKELAKELRVPVMALSQLSRKVEERDGGKPMLSDLRESGAIEQDADMVWFVHRPSKYQKADDPQVHDAAYSELIVAKHRNGPLKDIKLTFKGEHAAFYNYVGDQNESFNNEF
jgi:replicative DNA helicase